jgi:glucose dehydrogenase
MSTKNVFASLFTLAMLSACGGSDAPVDIASEPGVAPESGAAAVDMARLMNAAEEPEMWLSYGGSYDETRHSSLASVNGDTIQELGVGWVYTMDKPRGAEATPIVG